MKENLIMAHSINIAIIGNIGAGKSTLINQMTSNLSDSMIIRACQPFGIPSQFFVFPEEFVPKKLEKFYNNPQKHAYALQLEFLKSRIKRSQSIHKIKGVILEDRTLFEDFHIFGQAQHLLGRMNAKQFKKYQQFYLQSLPLAHHPDLVVYLQASPDDLLARIQKRNRASEANIDIEYLTLLNRFYEKFIASFCPFPIIKIETSHQNDLLSYTRNIEKSICQKLKSSLTSKTI